MIDKNSEYFRDITYPVVMRCIYIIFSVLAIAVFSGCADNDTQKSRGAIRFGDSSLIVTETDERYLSDNIADFVPQKPEAQPIADTFATRKPVEPKDTIRQQPSPAEKPEILEKQQSVATGKGQELPFKAFTVFIEGIQASSKRAVDWNTTRGVSLSLEQGELNNKKVLIKSPSVTKVMQRYQTVVLLKTGGKEHKLALPPYTAEWQTVKTGNGQFVISNLGKNQLKYDNRFTPALLNSAVQKLARSSRMSRKETDQLLRSVRGVRSPSQAPLMVALQSATWKITAKDGSGKVSEKEIRIDLNH